MQSNSDVLQHLNAVLSHTLSAINQYFLHARMYRNWGLNQLNECDYRISIKEMKHADKLIERILFLEGLPNLQHIPPIQIGEDITEIINCDLDKSQALRRVLTDAIAYCEQVADYVSRELLTNILDQEEHFIDWCETQQTLIKNMGLENYQQSQMDTGE